MLTNEHDVQSSYCRIVMFWHITQVVFFCFVKSINWLINLLDVLFGKRIREKLMMNGMIVSDI